MKTLVVTEKKSVADDFARTLGGFKKQASSYTRDDMVIAWASGHLLELQGPSEYDKKYKRWALGDLPIMPDSFVRVPRESSGKGRDLLDNLTKHMRDPDVNRIVNACDAGREGELIFNLIVDHAGVRKDKPVERLWLQSMTQKAIRSAFDGIVDDARYQPLRDAAYARDEADWMVGMNGTRAFTKKFMGRAKSYFAVGRVKTPTLAFLVDREREIDAFNSVAYFQIDGTFAGAPGKAAPDDAPYVGRWSGLSADGKKTDRLPDQARADAIIAKVKDQPGVATEKTTQRSEGPPLLFDLTSIQREASSRYGYTLDRTLSLVQSLYEAKKAVTYPRTSSRYLPSDYDAEVPKLIESLRGGDLAHVVGRAMEVAGGTVAHLKPAKTERVFNDAKVSDHFAIIPTGEIPKSLRDDEARIYELIVRRFLAVFLPAAKWENVVRETVVSEECFVTRSRRLATPGWRAVEPLADTKMMPPLPEEGAILTQSIERLDKETQPPARYSDGSLVKAMETAGKDGSAADGTGAELDEETLEELKEKGIGTPATRAAIVKDLINKGLARRQSRSILPTPLGCTLVRIVRNMDLGVLAKAELTGDWEYRLALMSQGDYPREKWDADIRSYVDELVKGVRETEGGNEEIFARDHPKNAPLTCPFSGRKIIEKTFSFMVEDAEEDDLNISKNQRGKYLFPEVFARLLADRKVGPMTGFDGTKAPGFIVLKDDGEVEVELLATADDDEEDTDNPEDKRENVPEGTLMGKCPKCGGKVTRQGMGYKCEKNIPRKKDKECDFRLAEKIKYRYLPPDQIRAMLSGEKTEELFGFVSMRGKKFRARLYYEDGDLKWQFPERKKKASKKKAAKKKASKKASKKKTTKKVAKKAAEPTDG